MKQKLFTLLLALVASVSTAFAHDAEIDGIYYNFKTSFVPPMSFNYTATVTYCGDYSNEYSGSVVIPSSVTYDGTTYSVTSIGDEAFRSCESLTSITIPNSVTSIGKNAFYDCSSLTSITIPNSVTSIGELAFYYCSSLTSVTIPNSVTSIGWATFSGCSSLTSVTIPNSVTSIGDQAFSNCYSLTSVTIPNSVTTIGYSAFSSCSSLTSVTIPNSVTSIKSYTFSGCSSLISIIIPNSVISIGYEAFRDCSSLTSVTIPNSVTSIGDYAFYYCSSLISITIPNSVTSIGYNAFFDVLNIIYHGAATGAPWGARVMNGYVEGNLVYEDSTKTTLLFCSYSAQGEIIIPNTVTNIGELAFYYCSSLTSVTIPNSVTSIGVGAFSGCSSLTSITIPNSVTSIGENAFYNISNIVYHGTATGSPWGAKSVNGYVENNLVYADEAKKVLLACFTSAQGEIIIPNTVISIGNSAFYSCSSVTSVTIGNSVTSIGEGAFARCTGLTSVKIPYSVSNIGKAIFLGCTSLTSIEVDSNNSNYCSIDGILFNKFQTTLVAYPAGREGAYTIPLGVVSIGYYAFCECSSLTSVTISDSVTSIGDNAFQYCSSLASVTIPNSVTEIGEYAFYGCDKLVDVYCYATTPPVTKGEDTFSNYNAFLYVPCESKKAYMVDAVWGNFKYIECVSSEGIENISSSLQGGDRGRLILRDGQVLILRNGKTYTMQGVEVK